MLTTFTFLCELVHIIIYYYIYIIAFIHPGKRLFILVNVLSLSLSVGLLCSSVWAPEGSGMGTVKCQQVLGCIGRFWFGPENIVHLYHCVVMHYHLF